MPQRKRRAHVQTGVDIVQKFLRGPRVAQEVIVVGLRYELAYGDQTSALELWDVLQGDERSRAVIAHLENTPQELTEQEIQELVAILQRARLLKLLKS